MGRSIGAHVFGSVLVCVYAVGSVLVRSYGFMCGDVDGG